LSSAKTTLWVSRETKDRLAKLGKKGESYDVIVRKLIDIAEGEVDIYVEFLTVDGDDAYKHKIVFQLGDYVYSFEKGKFQCLHKPARKSTTHRIQVGRMPR
jgi:hypothetical protein